MSDEKTSELEYGSRAHLRAESFACHAVEGNVVTDKHIEMFKMFDREGFTDEQRIAYITEQAQQKPSSVFAAE